MTRKTRRGPAASAGPDLDTLLRALRGDDALLILRQLADRDPATAKVIETLAKEQFEEVDADDVAADVLSELECLRVEDVWDRAGPRRDGYSDPGEVAVEMLEEALSPFADEVDRLVGLGLLAQVDACFSGMLRGLYQFGTASATPFRDEAADAVEEQFGGELLNWRDRRPGHATPERLHAFLAKHCPQWAARASEFLRRAR